MTDRRWSGLRVADWLGSLDALGISRQHGGYVRQQGRRVVPLDVGEVRDLVREHLTSWRYDHVEDGRGA